MTDSDINAHFDKELESDLSSVGLTTLPDREYAMVSFSSESAGLVDALTPEGWCVMCERYFAHGSVRRVYMLAIKAKN